MLTALAAVGTAITAVSGFPALVLASASAGRLQSELRQRSDLPSRRADDAACSQSELEVTKARAHDADRAKSLFMATMCHGAVIAEL